jgi:fibronectin-binding autotransporter adhesin
VKIALGIVRFDASLEWGLKGEIEVKTSCSAHRARLLAGIVLAAASTPLFSEAASGQTWISRSNGQFSDPSNWAGGQVPVSSPATTLYFTNMGHASYRAFNDLGMLTLGGITLETRTGTATFIGQDPGSAFEFVDGAVIRTTDVGLFRFGGVAGVVNDWRLNGNLILTAESYGSTFIASPITGSGGLTVNSPGPSEIDTLFRLEGSNTFTGGVVLQQGVVEIATGGGFGSGDIIANGGAFRSSSAVIVVNNITANSDLKLRTIVGLTLAGVISGPGGIDLRGVGSSPFPVALTNANTYTGATTVDLPVAYNGPLDAAGMRASNIIFSGNGSALNTSAYNIRNGGIATIDFSTNPGMNRLSDTAPMNLTNGRINALGNNTAGNDTIERVGPVNVRGGSMLWVSGRNGGMEVSTPAINRIDRSTMMITLVNAASRVTADTGPTLSGGIIPWMSGTSGTTITSPRELFTYESGGFRALAPAEYTDNDLNAGAAANVRLTTDSVNNAVVDVNALVVGTSTTTGIGITGTGTIRPLSGAVVLANNQPITNNIDFGSAEGIFHVGNIAIVDGVISGSNGITKSGDFSLATSATHNYTGVTTINGGGFRFTNPNTFDSTSGFVNSTGGGGELVPSLEYRGVGVATISKPATVASGAFRLSASTAGNNALDFAGVVSGPGAVYLESTTANTGRLILSNDNTYTGGTRIFNAEVEINRDSNLGDPNGYLEINGTAGQGIVLTGDWHTSRPIRVRRLTTLNAGSHDMSWSGLLDSSANLTKLGSGTWRITPQGIGNGGAAGWNVGTATSSTASTGGRVEIDGHVRMNWSVWDGALAVDGSVRILNLFSLGGGQAILAPGDIGGPGIGVTDAWSVSLARGSTVLFDLGEESDLITAVTTFSRGTGDGSVNFDFRVGPGTEETTYTLVEYFSNPAAGSTFDIGDFAFTSDTPGFDGFFSLVGEDGARALSFTVTVVPEPATLSLVGLGAAALLLRRRRNS